MPRESKTVTVESDAELLAFLFATWPAEKRKQIRTWLKFQAVTVNGRPVTQFNHPLRRGDVVSIREDRFAAPRAVVGAGMKVYFEDAHIIVIEKPAGLLSIASEAEPERTAYFQLTEHLRHGNPRAKERVCIVHRLDRETSGLMVFAKTPQAKDVLQSTWDTAEKRYEAVVEGRLPAESGTLESHLDETNPFRVFSAPRSAQTRHAVTHYRVPKQGPSRSLVELTLETGRRHQIRVQLKDAGCPIVGDKKYGAKTDPVKRLALHACALRIRHPVTERELSFQSPLPKLLARLV
jgi:23S rRNA pseudouridine1911/1915/1917 synthase